MVKQEDKASNISALKKTYNDTLKLIPLDIEKAKELLTELDGLILTVITLEIKLLTELKLHSDLNLITCLHQLLRKLF